MARQNFMCCSSCAAYEIAINPRNYGRLYAFYNRQSNDAWELGRWDRKPTGRLKDTLYIQFGLVRGADNEEIERMKVVQAGRTIVEEAEALGLQVKWNGTAEQAIGILPEPMPVAA